MLSNIKNSARAKKELKMFRDSIEKIKNSTLKRHVENLYKELEAELDLIQNGHSSEYDGNIEPLKNRENIDRVVQLRNQLYQFVKN